MDLSNLSNLVPNLSNVLTPDTLKVVGVIMALLTVKWVLGKAWAITKAVAWGTLKATTTGATAMAGSMSVVGVISSVLMLGGLGGTGYGIGQVKKPTTTDIVVACPKAPGESEEVIRAKVERRLVDYQRLPYEKYKAKWMTNGEESLADETLPAVEKPADSFVKGSTSIGLGLGMLVISVVAFIKKYG